MKAVLSAVKSEMERKRLARAFTFFLQEAQGNGHMAVDTARW